MRPLFLVAVVACAQPAFEVASVKPSPPDNREIGGFYTYAGGRIVARGCPFYYLVQVAFNVRPFQISGGPTWIREDRFDIEARPPESSKSLHANPAIPRLPPNEEQRQMLQTLLIDRFQLKYRRETKEGRIFVLTRTNKKLRLEEAKDKDAYPWAGGAQGGGFDGAGVVGTNVTMPEFAERLSPYFDRPVLDKTGLEGSFDFKFTYFSADPNPDVAASILVSLEALGLKLEPTKGPVETIVIEKVEKLAGN
jgi:uncharacterized protein (TIGR03435 family)